MRSRAKHHARGTATVEAVVVLPVFVILLVGMFFVRDLTGTRLSADQEVRRCSWEYALNSNCGTPPAGCDGVVGGAHYGSLLPENIDNALGSFSNGSKNKDSSLVNSKGFARVKRVIEQFVERYLAEAVTKRFEAQKTIERDRPKMFGGGRSVLRGKYNLACNVQPQGQEDVADAVWGQFKP